MKKSVICISSILVFIVLSASITPAFGQRSLFSDTARIDIEDRRGIDERKIELQRKENVIAVKEESLEPGVSLNDAEQLRLKIHDQIIVVDKLLSEEEGSALIWSGNIRDREGTVVLVYDKEKGLTGSIILDDEAENYQIESVSSSAHLVVRRKQAKGADDTRRNIDPEPKQKNLDLLQRLQVHQ